MEKLSLVHVVIIIAFGILCFFMLFIIAKRQITRFTLKSGRRPHVPIGTDAPKALQKEIQRRLKRIEFIKYEPRFISNDPSGTLDKSELSHHYYRMKVMDDITQLDEEIKKHIPNYCGRHPIEPISQYLIGLHGGLLNRLPVEFIHNLIVLYEHARHSAQEFDETEYNTATEYINQIVDYVRQLSSTADIPETEKQDVQVVFQSNRRGHEAVTTSVTHPRSKTKGGRSQERARSNTVPGQEKPKLSRPRSSDRAALLESRHSSQRSSTDRSTSTQGSIEKLIRQTEVTKEPIP